MFYTILMYLFQLLQQQMEGRPVNLLQERNLIPPTGVPDQKPNLAHDFKKVNCAPE